MAHGNIFQSTDGKVQTENFPQGVTQMKEERRKWKQDFWSMEISVLHVVLLIFTITQWGKYYASVLEINKRGLREFE